MSRNVSDLHPRLQQKVKELQTLCNNNGLPIGIGECLRTVNEQNELYAQGRTKPGSIVTNATGTSYKSQHQWGIAFDFFKNIKGHEFDDIWFFNRVGSLGKSIGLGWGGDWTSPVDKPHLYLPDWGSTPTALRNQYGTPENFRKNWTDVNSSTGGFCYMFKVGTVKMGYRGNDTILLQKLLKSSGANPGEIDGICGKNTVLAIRAYQTTHKECGEVDGICGVRTWASIVGL